MDGVIKGETEGRMEGKWDRSSEGRGVEVIRNIVQRCLRRDGGSATEEGRGLGYTFIITKLLHTYMYTSFCYTNIIILNIQYKITRKEKWQGELKETIESL